MNELSVNWPKNLDILNITEVQKNSLDNFLKVFIPEYLKQYISTTPSCFKPFTYLDKKWEIQVNFRFLYNIAGKIQHIILHLEGDTFILGKGTQRVVRRCYDLSKGCFCAEKKISLIEKDVLSKLKGKGVPEIYGFYSTLVNKKVSYFVVEKLYEFTLDDLFQRKSKVDFSTRIGYMLQLITGLVTLHSTPLSNKLELNTAHFDIKALNILIKEQEIALTDFGFVGDIYKISYTPIALSPEYWDFINKKPRLETVFAFNKSFGKARDIWAMGLIFLDLLMLGASNSLRCIVSIRNNYETNSKEIHFEEKAHQEDLARLRKISKNPIFELIEKMLSLEPKNRPTAEQCLTELTKILEPLKEKSYFLGRGLNAGQR